MLYNIKYVMLYNICYVVMLYNMCHVMWAAMLTCSQTDAFQVVVYEAEFFSQCVMGRFLFLTRVTNEGISFRV